MALVAGVNEAISEMTSDHTLVRAGPKQEQCEWGLPAPVHTGITLGVIYDQARLNVSCVNYIFRRIAFVLLWCHHFP